MKKKLLKQKLQMLYKVNDELRKELIHEKNKNLPHYNKNSQYGNYSKETYSEFRKLWDEAKPKDIIETMTSEIKECLDSESPFDNLYKNYYSSFGDLISREIKYTIRIHGEEFEIDKPIGFSKNGVYILKRNIRKI